MGMVVCKQCGDLLNSVHVHDFVQCECPNGTFVDGGNDYFKRGGKDMALVLEPFTGTEARRLSAGIKAAIANKMA